MTHFFELPDFAGTAPVSTETAAGFAAGLHVALEPDRGRFLVRADTDPAPVLALELRPGAAEEPGWAEMGLVVPGETWMECNRFTLLLEAGSQAGCQLRPQLNFEGGEALNVCAANTGWNVAGDRALLETSFTPAPRLRAGANMVRLVFQFHPTAFDLKIYDLVLVGFR